MILWGDTIQVNLKPVSVFRQLPNILVPIVIKPYTTFSYKLHTWKLADLRPNLFKTATISTSGLQIELKTSLLRDTHILEAKK